MPDIRPAVSDLSPEQLVSWLGKHGEPAYRAKQIRRHATHGTERGFDERTEAPVRFVPMTGKARQEPRR